jgi:hypothetical protein
MISCIEGDQDAARSAMPLTSQNAIRALGQVEDPGRTSALQVQVRGGIGPTPALAIRQPESVFVRPFDHHATSRPHPRR